MPDNQTFDGSLQLDNQKAEAESEYDDDDDDEDVNQFGELHKLGEFKSSLQPAVEAEKIDYSQSETLVVPSMIPVGDCRGVDGLRLNSDFPATIEEMGFKKQVGASFHDIKAEAALHQTQNQDQLHSAACPTFSSELSPTSITQSFSSAPSPTLDKVNNACTPGANNRENSPNLKAKSSSDGFKWRKYGQKLVKSPKGSRSYYKCTSTECCAKRVDCCDQMGHVLEMVYKGQHNHEPPRKISGTRENRLASSSGPVVANNLMEHPTRSLNGSDPLTSSKEPLQETFSLPKRKRQNSSGSSGDSEIEVKEESVNEPDPKQRVKKNNIMHSGSLTKPGKKPKFVVHAAGDVGISGDGYRWRKYGQKMVKGNPHPRNYYKCTSAGCPVRKHIETAVDNTSAVIITYKGVHDHDMPVPKKRQGPPSAPLVAATAPASASMNNLQLTTVDLKNQISQTQWSVDAEGELTGATMERGNEKAMESARTLLSIGFEIKPC